MRPACLLVRTKWPATANRFVTPGLNSVSKTVKFVAQYAAEQSYCVGMFLYTLFGIFLLPAILTQNIERFDLLGGAGIISKLASGPCFLLR